MIAKWSDDLGVVEDALRRLDVALLQRRLGVRGERAQRAGQVLLGDHRHRVLAPPRGSPRAARASRCADRSAPCASRTAPARSTAWSWPRSRSGRWPRAAAWSGRTAAALACVLGLASSVTRAGWPRTASAMAARLGLVPEAVGAQLGVVGVLLPRRVEPLAFVLAGLGREGRAHLPVVARARACGSSPRARPRSTASASAPGPTVVRKKPPSRELNAVIARVPLMPTSQSASERQRAASARPCICLSLRSCVEAVADRLRRHRSAARGGAPACRAACRRRRTARSGGRSARPRGPRRRR